MNILRIFSDLKQYLTANNLKLVYEAYNIFKKKDVMNKGFNEVIPEIDSVLQRLNMSRSDLSKMLPMLDNPKVRDVLDGVMPNSVGNLKSLVGYLDNNNYNNNSNNNYNNNYNNNNNNNNNNINNIDFKFPDV